MIDMAVMVSLAVSSTLQKLSKPMPYALTLNLSAMPPTVSPLAEDPSNTLQVAGHMFDKLFCSTLPENKMEVLLWMSTVDELSTAPMFTTEMCPLHLVRRKPNRSRSQLEYWDRSWED